MDATTTPHAPLSASTRASAWYRERWLLLLIAGPVVVVVASLVTLVLALASEDGLVADDYYRQGLAINRTSARLDRAAQLGIEARLTIGRDGNVVLELASDDGLARPATIALSVLHATQAGADSRAILAREQDGRYRGRVEPPAPGRWRIVVESEAWRLPAAETSNPYAPLAIRAAERVQRLD